MPSEDPKKLKEAFAKIKHDIFSLQVEIDKIKRTLNQSDRQTTDRQQSPNTSTHNTTDATDKLPSQPLYSPYSNSSTGNRGVSTDRQQTDNRQTTDTKELQKFAQQPSEESYKQSTPSLQKVPEFLDSLESIKSDLSSKIKSLTTQEMSVLISLYELSSLKEKVDYSSLAQTLKLTESSIRDYIQRIIKKGIPIAKIKENNKKVTLSLSKDLKKVASLETILQIRENNP
jgi:DNA-binding MarR family transcriptional regulator